MTREAGGGLGRTAHPLTSLLIKTLLSLILNTRAGGGDIGSIYCPLTSLLIQTQVRNMILKTREAGVG